MNSSLLTWLLIIACSPANYLFAQTISRGSYYKDPEGDTNESGKAGAYFDITGLNLETQGTDTLRFTIETKSAIPERPESERTWIGLYIDLDKNPATGLPSIEMGSDLIISLESFPDGSQRKWAISVDTPSPIGSKYSYHSRLVSHANNRLTIEVTSSQAFIDYPQFVIQAYAQKEGNWLDHIDSLGSTPVTLFPVTQAAVNYSETNEFKRTLIASAGHIHRQPIPANNRTKEIRCDVDIKTASPSDDYTCYVRINLKNRAKEDIIQFRLALSKQRKNKAVVRIYNHGDSKDPHYLSGYENPYFIGKHIMVLRILDSGVAEFEIDGRVQERLRVDFDIHAAEIRAGSCTAQIVTSTQ